MPIKQKNKIEYGDKVKYDTAPSCMGSGTAYYCGVFEIGKSKYYEIKHHSMSDDRMYYIPYHSKIEKYDSRTNR